MSAKSILESRASLLAMQMAIDAGMNPDDAGDAPRSNISESEAQSILGSRASCLATQLAIDAGFSRKGRK